MIDWSRTRAWSEGGYYARVFLNVKGREPQGIIEPEQYDSVRDQLCSLLSNLDDESGNLIRNSVLRPGDIYRDCRNVPPDLMVYFGDLALRSIGTVGGKAIVQDSNIPGMDSANHDFFGIFIETRLSDLRRGIRRDIMLEDISCLDITPTVLHEFGLPVPHGLGGTVIKPDEAHGAIDRKVEFFEKPHEKQNPASGGFTSEEEAVVMQRLKDLGYL